jgi:hypothetical protein
MRLTSTGLGIGTSSPAGRLDSYGDGTNPAGIFRRGGAYGNIESSDAARSNRWTLGRDNASTGNFVIAYNDATKASMDTSGNLGLGVTPSAWGSSWRVLEGSFGQSWFYSNTNTITGLVSNTYHNGTNWIYKTTNAAARYQLGTSNGDHEWYTAASGTAGNAITFTQAMTLDASGNLAVGVTSTGGAKLAVQGSGGSGYLTVGDGTATMLIGSGAALSSDSSIPYLRSGGSIGFATGGSTERARIDSSGNLLVGTTSYNEGVVGCGFASAGASYFTRSTSTNATTTVNVYSTGAAAYRFYVGMGGTVYATNTTISSLSDIRFKENVRDLNVGLTEIMALKPRLYDWKEGKGADIKNARGFIAQEFEEVFPDLIDTWKETPPEGEDPYKSVRADLIPVLVKAIQEQQALITALTARLDAANL